MKIPPIKENGQKIELTEPKGIIEELLFILCKERDLHISASPNTDLIDEHSKTYVIRIQNDARTVTSRFIMVSLVKDEDNELLWVRRANASYISFDLSDPESLNHLENFLDETFSPTIPNVRIKNDTTTN